MRRARICLAVLAVVLPLTLSAAGTADVHIPPGCQYSQHGIQVWDDHHALSDTDWVKAQTGGDVVCETNVATLTIETTIVPDKAGSSDSDDESCNGCNYAETDTACNFTSCAQQPETPATECFVAETSGLASATPVVPADTRTQCEPS